MAKNFRRIFNGLQLVGQNSITPTLAGEIRYNSSTGFFQIFDSITRNVVTDTGTQTLTGKTLTGNTAVNLVSGSGTLVLNTTGTITVPNGTDTLIGKNTTDTLTGKSISGGSNTLSAIPRSAINAGTASHVVTNDGSGNLSSEAQLAISRGGTGQSTANTGFNALSPTTTKGDLIAHNGTINVRVAVGTDGQFLKADSAQASGVSWDNSTVADNSINENKLTTSVAGNGLTGGNGTPLAVVVDDATIQITSDTLSLKDRDAITSSSGSFTSNSTSFVDITNLSTSFTTTGRRVVLQLVGDGSGSSAYVGGNDVGSTTLQFEFKFVRDASTVDVVHYESGNTPGNVFIPPGTIIATDKPAAGTYTYKVQGRIQSGNGTTDIFAVERCKLLVYEL